MTTPAHPPLSTLVPGSSFRQYTLLEQIGVGGQGVVWSALEPREGRIYAVKFNEIMEGDEALMEDERTAHQQEQLIHLRHPHILPLREFGVESNKRFTVSPFIAGGTLTQKIRTSPPSVEEAIRYGMEIASALDFLHSRGVIHRDLKSSNILLNLSNHSYLSDFGLARVVSTSTLAFHTGHGTPPYAPPEQNRLKEITPKSDIFSFGILLFELFTGQLPWNGRKQLGMEQLHSDAELPDPREVNTSLPPRLVDVLRRVTSANPDLRPRSAGEIMRVICHLFGVPCPPINEGEYDEAAAHQKDVEQLLWQGLAQWKATEGMYNLGLTRFAMADLERSHIDTRVFGGFLLSQALTYGYQDDYWWAAVSDPRERLSIASLLLRRESDVITSRILDHLTADMEIRAFSRGLPESVVMALFDIGTRTGDNDLRRRILQSIRALVPPSHTWEGKKLPLNIPQIQQLGDLALEDSASGDAAAELIGHLRAAPAVQVITNHHDDSRSVDALLLIQQTAGSLPSFVKGGIRLRLSLEWVFQRLIQKPVSLVGAYFMAFLGSSLGIAVQVYLTINLTGLFDSARIAISLERGLITGFVFGLGIFLTRVAVERFHASRLLPRLLFGTLTGALLMNLALLVFHILFVRTPPQGFLITASSLLIALAFAAGGLTRSYLFRVFLTSLTIWGTILAAWLLHTRYASSPEQLTPLFRYDYAWSLTQVALTALGVSLPMGILGNVVNLTLQKQEE
ncbi:MAG: serine/threonine-protein kinase [Chloroflexota bacterium]